MVSAYKCSSATCARLVLNEGLCHECGKRPVRERIQKILDKIKFLDREFLLMPKGDGFLVQLQYMEPCVKTGKNTLQKSRKWYLSPWMTDSEVVETVWAMCQRSHLHVAAEGFTFEGVRVYSPHYNIETRLYCMKKFPEDARAAK